MPLYLARLAAAHAELGQFDDARRCNTLDLKDAKALLDDLWR
jgi:hypothetical protein